MDSKKAKDKPKVKVKVKVEAKKKPKPKKTVAEDAREILHALHPLKEVTEYCLERPHEYFVPYNAYDFGERILLVYKRIIRKVKLPNKSLFMISNNHIDEELCIPILIALHGAIETEIGAFWKAKAFGFKTLIMNNSLTEIERKLESIT
jgi:hypothetical protein